MEHEKMPTVKVVFALEGRKISARPDPNTLGVAQEIGMSGSSKRRVRRSR